jgi:hypothetical protein
MANTLLSPQVIADAALTYFSNNLVAAKLVYREYENEFGDTKIGDTISIRKPVRYTVRDGNVASSQDTVEGKTTLVVNKQKGVDMEFASKDLTLTIERFGPRYIEPACEQLANFVDADVLALYKKVPNWVGTPGQIVNSFADFGLAPQRLDEMGVPLPRVGTISPGDQWGLLGSMTTLPAVSDTAKSALEKAKLPMLGGVDLYMAQNVQVHTVGTKAGTPLVNGAAQNVTYLASKDVYTQTLITDGWTASSAILKAGDVITLAGVFAVNHVSKGIQSYLKQFVVTADATADGTGNATLTISPQIITSGAYQNVSAAPADNAAITVLGTASTGYPQNMVFHKNAFALAMVPMELPDAAVKKARRTHEGLSIRIVSQYDWTNDKSMWRLDVLYGLDAINPEMATRLSGTA